MSKALMHAVWGGFRRTLGRYPAWLELSGPCTVLVIITSWTVLLAVGWALVYLPRMPGGFLLSPGLNPSGVNGFVDALYLSLMTLTTLGYGSITPTIGWLRIFATLEALIGFALLTASLSWVISLYPVFRRRRSLAHEITLLREAEEETACDFGGTGTEGTERMLENLTSQLVDAEGDLIRFPVTYYFHNANERLSLPHTVPYLARMAEKTGGADYPPGVRLRAARLRRAVDDYASTVASNFLGLPSASTAKALEAHARDHSPVKRGGRTSGRG